MTATYIEVCVSVRYWEDSSVNGVSDDIETLIPFCNGKSWRPVIELESGKIVSWPTGMRANISYKVCDEGKYWLLDKNKKRIAKWSGYYVPNDFLCHGDNGYGDYIMMNVNAKGYIYDYEKPAINRREWMNL